MQVWPHRHPFLLETVEYARPLLRSQVWSPFDTPCAVLAMSQRFLTVSGTDLMVFDEKNDAWVKSTLGATPETLFQRLLNIPLFASVPLARPSCALTGTNVEKSGNKVADIPVEGRFTPSAACAIASHITLFRGRLAMHPRHRGCCCGWPGAVGAGTCSNRTRSRCSDGLYWPATINEFYTKLRSQLIMSPRPKSPSRPEPGLFT